MSKYRSLEHTYITLTEKHNPAHPKGEKDMNDQVFAGSYRSQHFEVSPDAQRIYADINKEISPDKIERSVKQHDQLFGLLKQIEAKGHSTEQDVAAAESIVQNINKAIENYEVPVDHPHLEKTLNQIKSKIKVVDNIIKSDPSKEDLKQRFASPTDEYSVSEPVSDKDIDNVKNFHVSRAQAAKKQRFLNTGVDEQYSAAKTIKKVLKKAKEKPCH